MISRGFQFGLILLLAGCSTFKGDKQVGGDIIYPPLATALTQFDNEMQKTRLALQFSDGSTVTNCRAYFSVKSDVSHVETGENMIAAQDYVLCDTLELLHEAKQVTGYIRDDVGPLIATEVDLRSFPSSLFQRVDDQHFTLHQLFGNQLQVESNAVIVDNSDWYYELRLVAIADIDGNQQNDWIFWLTDKAKQGTYSTFSVLIAHDVNLDSDSLILKPINLF